MPTYEYRCQHCQHKLEARQSMHDSVLVHCPDCGQDTLQRLISRSAFQLKGKGWYADGYNKTANEKSAETTSDHEIKQNTNAETSSKPVDKDKLEKPAVKSAKSETETKKVTTTDNKITKDKPTNQKSTAQKSNTTNIGTT